MKVLDLPDGATTLRMMSSPSFHSAPESSSISLTDSLTPQKTASTVQFWAPSEITEASAFPPASSPKAPRSMDLPAPVCPEMMTRPSGKSISRESIRI